MTPESKRKLIAGNWKMNMLAAEGLDLARGVAELLSKDGGISTELLICPPATLIAPIAQAIKNSGIAVGGQDCHAQESGAHTGDLGAEMLRDAGASYVILGHSERRQDHGETDAQVRAKLTAAHRAGLIAIICIGETLEQRDAGQTLAVLSSQIEGSLGGAVDGLTAVNMAIAYEPVWAIGTGHIPTLAQIVEAHTHIRLYLGSLIGDQANDVRLLYGGSMKPSNAAELLILDNVDGGLIGGASLRADDFWAIAASVPA